MGRFTLSVRGEGPWRGYSRLNVVDRGQRRLLKLENGYVSADGSEVRSMPGFACILDLSQENNELGYARWTYDVVKPIYVSSPDVPYAYKGVDGNKIQTLDARALPTHFHAFEQCFSEFVVIGETRFREWPVTTLGGGIQQPDRVFRDGATQRWSLRFPSSIATTGSLTDLTGAGLDYTTTEALIYCEGLSVGDPDIDALLDANLNNRIHAISFISSDEIALLTLSDPGMPTSPQALVSGTAGRVSPNRSNVYDPVTGTPPYSSFRANRPNDPDQLTVWRVVGPPSFGDIEKQCLPAWVANRQRDIGDREDTNITDGIHHQTTNLRGISRREMRKLPFRISPETAADRIIIAAPQYGCMFQVPLRIPVDPLWPATSQTAGGLLAPSNGVRDKPRALGVPKARLVEPAFMDTAQAVRAVTTSNTVPFGDSFLATAWGQSPSGAVELAEGVWQTCVTYWDPVLNVEGLPSETVRVELSGELASRTWGLQLHILHPGYIMPECLATHVRIYIAEPGSDTLKFYMSAPIDYLTSGIGAGTLGYFAIDFYLSGSSEYGLEAPGSPAYPNHLWCTVNVPFPLDGSALESALDETKQPRRGANMPRGATAARMLRGVLLAGGAMGNAGRNYSMWQAYASIEIGSPGVTISKPEEMFIRCYGIDLLDQGLMDGSPTTSTLGIAGRCFPDAYQGLEVVAPQLFPSGGERQVIDRVGNRRAFAINFHPSGAYGNTSGAPASINFETYRERLILERPWSADLRAPVEAASDYPDTFGREEQPIYFLMPQGQLQIGDPGAPDFSSKAAIKIFDSTQGEDIVAIGRMSSTAVVCSRRETYQMSWYRSAIGEELNKVSNEHGCIATNSMVEFDGGLAWLSERGPVAYGGQFGLDFVGVSIAEDFYGDTRRYLADSDGLMRHAWACHDQGRGLVMWGLVTKDATHTVTDEGMTFTWSEASNQVRSRFPCDEVLVWSYRANAFSTWRPPVGLEVLWMRPVRDDLGNVRICFLAADGRVYAFDDAFNDRNGRMPDYGFDAESVTADIAYPIVGSGSSTSTLSFTGAVSVRDGDYGALTTKNEGLYLAPGMAIDILDLEGKLTAQSSISQVQQIAGAVTDSSIVTLSTAVSWSRGYRVRIGPRPKMTLVSSFMDDARRDSFKVDHVQLRYSLLGGGDANVKVTLLKPEYRRETGDESVQSRQIATDDPWPSLGRGRTDLADAFGQIGQRVSIPTRADGHEIAVKIEVSGNAQMRLQDLTLEVG